MPPPPTPVTPSPHRFVVKKQPPARKTPLVPEHIPRPSQQFNATPRFNFSSTPRPVPSQSVPASTPVPRFLTPARPLGTSEDIVDFSSSDGLQDVRDSTEGDDQHVDYEYLSEEFDDGSRTEERTPKRQRRSSSSSMLLDENDHSDLNVGNDHTDFNSSPLPILSSPATRVPKHAPRFILHTPVPPSSPQVVSTQPTFLKPRRFRPPDPAEQAQTQTDPLPEQFSPYRRGQQYILGGLASEVRDWLTNIGSSTTSSATQRKDEPWLVKLLIDKVGGGGRAGMTLVRGRKVVSIDEMIDSMGEVEVLLAGEGAVVGIQKGVKLEVGMTVGIKGPVWEVVIQGGKWGVGVDWKVLES